MTYAELRPEVRAIVDRNAEVEAKRLGLPVEQVRELIAARVETKTYSAAHGTGHRRRTRRRITFREDSIMKRITVSVTVDDTYNRDAHRWLKDEMIQAAMERVVSSALTVTSIEAKISTPRKATS